MSVNNIHSQVRHLRGIEEKEEEEPPERSLEVPQEEAAAEVYRLKSAHRLKPALTPAIAGLLESATSWP
jgi:hypothetical protein